MPARPAPLLTAAGVLAMVGLALAAAVQPLAQGADSSGPAEYAGFALLALAAAAAALALLMVEPAWPLSISVVLMAFSGNWELAGSPLPLDRLVLLLGLLSLAGRAHSLRDVFGREPTAVHVLIGLATLYVLASAAFTGTLGEEDSTFAILDRYGLVPFVLFAVAPAAFREARSRRVLLICLTALGGYLAYVSILSRVGPESLIFPSYITDPTVGTHIDRARGPFIEAGANGMALFACAVAALILARELSSWARRAAIAIAFACALSIVLTLTRSVWVASAVGAALAMLAHPQTRRWLIPAALAGVAAVAAMLAFVPGLQGDVEDRASDERPLWDRQNANAAAVRMIAERPVLGFGWFTFDERNAEYQRLAEDRIITRADLRQHNVFLANAVELGVIGTIIWGAALLGALGGAILRRGPPELDWWRVGLVAIAVQWFIVANFVPLSYALPNALLWLWAGILWTERSAAVQRPVDRL